MFEPIYLGKLKIEKPVFAAPLAGITDWPYRQILRKCAPDAPILTEMISAHSLIANFQKADKSNCHRNFDNFGKEGLIGAQIFGAGPEVIGTAVKILEQNGAKWIDVNMGCPVPKVATRSCAGAYLMRDHKLAGEIVAAIVKSVGIPVTVKTRLGWDADHINANELIKIVVDNGASLVTVHGRTRAVGYAGPADLNRVAEVTHGITDIPIIFNGDIKTVDDLVRVKNMGASGAMIGRAILGNPMLMGELTGADTKYPLYDLIMEHFELSMSYYGAATAVPMFRKYAAWYAHGRENATDFRVRINTTIDVAEMKAAIRDFFIESI